MGDLRQQQVVQQGHEYQDDDIHVVEVMEFPYVAVEVLNDHPNNLTHVRSLTANCLLSVSRPV